jgi:hypothetical protein
MNMFNHFNFMGCPPPWTSGSLAVGTEAEELFDE